MLESDKSITLNLVGPETTKENKVEELFSTELPQLIKLDTVLNMVDEELINRVINKINVSMEDDLFRETRMRKGTDNIYWRFEDYGIFNEATVKRIADFAHDAGWGGVIVTCISDPKQGISYHIDLYQKPVQSRFVID